MDKNKIDCGMEKGSTGHPQTTLYILPAGLRLFIGKTKSINEVLSINVHDAVYNIFALATPRQRPVFLNIMQHYIMPFQLFQLKSNTVIGNGKIKFLGGNGHIIRRAYAAKYQFTFICFKQISFMGKFLQ